MTGIESWLLAYLLNSLWQIPLLFVAAWLIARILRSLGPAAEHRVWVAALLLQTLLPACSLSAVPWLRALSSWLGHSATPARERVLVSIGPGIGVSALSVAPGLLSAVTLAYILVLAFVAARFLWRVGKLAALRHSAIPLPLTGDAALCWTRCRNRFGVRQASLATSSRIFGPVTLGRLILLPQTIAEDLSPADLETILAHEFAHLQRRDFLKNLAYELLSLPAQYHPLFWLTREHLIESREVVCDALAAEVAGPKAYARSLLRLASLLLTGPSARSPHAIGIFDANALERRLMQLTQSQKAPQGFRRAIPLIACITLGFAACASALALRMNVAAAPGPGANSSTTRSRSPEIPSGVMAGQILTRVNPVYPPEARKAKIQGTVRLQATINKQGIIENLQVLSGPEELRRSSLDAVRQWTYKPYRLNGEETDVQTTINVNYALEP